jgi:hypothetical protein
MNKIKAIWKLLKAKQYILIADNKVSTRCSSRFIERAMIDIMDAVILEVEQRQAVEEVNEIINTK